MPLASAKNWLDCIRDGIYVAKDEIPTCILCETTIDKEMGRRGFLFPGALLV
jgi:hypothetical protein